MQPTFHGPRTKNLALVIGDSMIIRKISELYLSGMEWSTIATDNPKEGIEMARERLPQVILLDDGMPHGDGHHVLTILAADPILRWIPVFMLSHDTSALTRARFEAAGAAGIISKPFARNCLHEAVMKAKSGRWLAKVERAELGGMSSPTTSSKNAPRL